MHARFHRCDLAFLVPIAGATGLFIAIGSCDEKPELPKEDAPPVRPIEIDVKHTARIQAGGRSFTLANLVLVLQHDHAHGGMMGVTLSTTQPGQDGSRMIFGSLERADSIDELAKTHIDFGGAAMFDAQGNGVFTSLGAYLPKAAEIRITSHDTAQAQGTIHGQFYRFKTDLPTLHPNVVTVNGTFSAKLVER
jgi:hypothetical protein